MPRRRPKLPTDSELRRAKNPKDLILVRVHWKDACLMRYWKSIIEVRQAAALSPVISTGLLLKRTREIVVIAGSIAGDHLGNFNVIPTANVERIEIVESKPCRKK